MCTKNLEFSGLTIGFIDNLKFKANIIKGNIYLCRIIATEKLQTELSLKFGI